MIAKENESSKIALQIVTCPMRPLSRATNCSTKVKLATATSSAPKTKMLFKVSLLRSRDDLYERQKLRKTDEIFWNFQNSTARDTKFVEIVRG